MEGGVRRTEVVTVQGRTSTKALADDTGGTVQRKTVSSVFHGVIQRVRKVRKAIREELCEEPSGRHLIGTVPFGALLPTVWFHVLFRTGHPDLDEAFWFRPTYTLHASNHLKYQERSSIYAFLRGILPPVMAEELHDNTPGSCVVKLLSFNSGNREVLDRREWSHVHWGEALEILIVRHLKSLRLSLPTHLENAAALLMEFSRFRFLCRRTSGTPRVYGEREDQMLWVKREALFTPMTILRHMAGPLVQCCV